MLNKQGYSIRLRNPQANPQACSVGVNMYLTPPKAQGFPPHYDEMDAFIVQVEGTKCWKVYGPRYLTPPKAQGFPPHYDNMNAFIVQVEGTKYLKVYGPRNIFEKKYTRKVWQDYQVTPVNPKPYLLSLVGKEVIIKLKWGMEYKGMLKCADAYLNIQQGYSIRLRNLQANP